MIVPDDGSVQTYAEVDIYLNDFYPTRQTALLSRVVIEHELGHALGLPHSESPRSVMSYSYDPGYNIGRWRGVLQPVDVNALASLYAAP
jgi:predicted Zn-dependent protease